MEIEVVTIKLGLDRVAPQTEEVLLEFLVFLVLPVLVDVLLVEVVLLGRDEGSLQFAVPKVVPWEVSQPGVGLDLGRTVEAESICRLPLYHLGPLRESKDYLVDEVSRFNGPALGDFVSLDLDLFGQYVVSDLLAALTDIRPLPR